MPEKEAVQIGLKKFPPVIQRMWEHVYDSVFLKTDGNEQRAIKAGKAVVNKNMIKFGPSRYGHNAHINYLVDKFLGRL